MILQILGAAIGVVGGSVFLEAPRKTLPYAAAIGALGWSIFLLSVHTLTPAVSTFLAGLVIASLSHILARYKKIPVTIFLIPGFLPFFPGMDMYRAVESFMQASPLATDYTRSTFQIAGMIALSIFVVDSIVRALEKQPRKSKKPNIPNE